MSERVHSTLPGMLAMHSAIDQGSWASLLPFVQLAYNISFSAKMHETPFFLMFTKTNYMTTLYYCFVSAAVICSTSASACVPNVLLCEPSYFRIPPVLFVLQYFSHFLLVLIDSFVVLCDEIRLSVEFVTVGFLGICRQYCFD